MNNRLTLSIIAMLFLTACAPKYNYVNNQYEVPKFNHIVVVFDYLHVVDDVGKLFDYPEDKNQQQIAQLKSNIEAFLRAQGFDGSIEFALISSGLGLNPNTAFEHYLDGQLQPDLIYPPFYFATNYDGMAQDLLVQSFADAQNLAFTSVSKDNQNYFNDARMNSISLSMDGEEVVVHDGGVGVLHIRAVMPRVSFMKAMGVSLLTIGLTAGATGGAYVGIATPVGAPHSTGLLFDNATGQVLWKNQSSGDLSRFGKSSQQRFFKNFPDLSGQ